MDGRMMTGGTGSAVKNMWKARVGRQKPMYASSSCGMFRRMEYTSVVVVALVQNCNSASLAKEFCGVPEKSRFKNNPLRVHSGCGPLQCGHAAPALTCADKRLIFLMFGLCFGHFFILGKETENNRKKRNYKKKNTSQKKKQVKPYISRLQK